MSQQLDSPESIVWRINGRLESEQRQQSIANTIEGIKDINAGIIFKWNHFQDTEKIRRQLG